MVRSTPGGLPAARGFHTGPNPLVASAPAAPSRISGPIPPAGPNLLRSCPLSAGSRPQPGGLCGRARTTIRASARQAPDTVPARAYPPSSLMGPANSPSRGPRVWPPLRRCCLVHLRGCRDPRRCHPLQRQSRSRWLHLKGLLPCPVRVRRQVLDGAAAPLRPPGLLDALPLCVAVSAPTRSDGCVSRGVTTCRGMAGAGGFP